MAGRIEPPSSPLAMTPDDLSRTGTAARSIVAAVGADRADRRIAVFVDVPPTGGITSART